MRIQVGRAVLFQMLEQGTHLQGHRPGGSPQHRNPAAGDIRAIDSVLVEERVVDIARIGAGETAGSKRQRVTERNVDRAAYAVAELGSVVDSAQSRLHVA